MSSCILFGPADATTDFGVYEPMLRRSAVALSIYREVAELTEIGVALLYGGISLGELAALHSAVAASTEVVLGFLHERHLQDTDRDEAWDSPSFPSPPN